MKFLLSRSDGRVLGRIADDRLTFPIPHDVCVADSVEDIPERDMPNGSTLVQFGDAKIAKFQQSHPDFNSSGFTLNEELTEEQCDFNWSNGVTSGPGKMATIRSGGLYVSNEISCPVSIFLCVRWSSFLLGSPTATPGLQYYNFDESTQEFVVPPKGYSSGLQFMILDAVTPDMWAPLAMPFESDTELTSSLGVSSFRVGVYNNTPRAFRLAGWTFISKALIF